VVLCVDDDRLMLKYEKSFLERCGYTTVLTAPSGTDGLKMAFLHPVDVVILDYDMPDMNGAVVASGIRKLRPKALIIMLSGADVPEQVVKIVDAFVAKEQFSKQVVPVLTMLGASA
jgi:DNA-binding response OmpR family regulator